MQPITSRCRKVSRRIFFFGIMAVSALGRLTERVHTRSTRQRVISVLHYALILLEIMLGLVGCPLN